MAAFVLALVGRAFADESTAGRLKELHAQLGAGEYVEVESAARAFLQEVEASKGNDSVEAAGVLDMLVMSLSLGGKANGPAAREFAQRAVQIKEKALGPDHPDVATSLNNLADLLRATGDYVGARSLYERALAIREMALGPDHLDVAISLNNLAILRFATSDYAEARPLFQRALAIDEKALGPDHPDVAIGLNNLAGLLRVTGDYAGARPLYERALVIQEMALPPYHPAVASSLANLAGLRDLTGDYAGARPLYERALAIREKALGPDHPDVALSLNNVAGLRDVTGDYAGARPLYERALAIREKALGPDHPHVATSLNNLANVLYATGDHDGARLLYERALAIREKVLGPDHPDLAASLNKLANLLGDTGDYAGARPLYERALAIQRKAFGPDHPDVAQSLIGLAALEATLAETGGAIDHALEAERVGREHLRLTSRSLSERQALGYAAVRTSGLDLALTLAGHGLDPASRRRALDALIRSRALVLDEMAARQRAVSATDDPEVARRAGAVGAARTRLANLVVRGVGTQQPEVYRRLLEQAREDKEKAEAALAEVSAPFARERLHGRVGLEEVTANLPPESALVAFVQYRQIDLAPKRLAQKSEQPVAARGKGGDAQAPTAAAAAKAPNDVPSYLAFILRTGESEPQVVDLGGAAEIDALVTRWHEEAANGASREGRTRQQAEAAYEEAGASLRRKAWDPIATILGGATRVLVVPDSSLNLVNLGALPVDGGGYLIERGPLVHYVSAERDLVRPGEERVGAGLLTVGEPAYDARSLFASLRKRTGGGGPTSDGMPGPLANAEQPTIQLASAAPHGGRRSACGTFDSLRFEPLPASGTETREIVHLWERHETGVAAPAAVPSAKSDGGGVLELRGAAASETTVKQSAAGRRVLHLATHGFFLGGACASALRTTGAPANAQPRRALGENPLLLSGLALAGANQRAAAGEGEDDGILTAEEIASLDLSGVEWAVLAACESGVGDVLAGEGVFGLRRAFQVAGAGTLIMSLWGVEDTSTRRWMKALYESRLRDGRSTAEAVRAADLKVLSWRRANKLSTHPFYWAGFVAAGDWR
jgi:CHAT domain-containing protein/Tfp pilus assembly protein PilF